MYFCPKLFRLAEEFKRLGLRWEPSVGNYVYDAAGVVPQSSPFQDHVYFLLNYDCFMRKVGGVARFKQLMVWLPTWHEARLLLRSLGVSSAQVQSELARRDALAQCNDSITSHCGAGYRGCVGHAQRRSRDSLKLD